MSLIENIKSAAKGKYRTIVLPEGETERTLRAADIIIQEGLAKLILVGDKETISINTKQLGLNHIDKAEIYDANTDSWSRKSNMPTARGALISQRIGGYIFSVGGVSSIGVTGLNEVYNILEDK